MVWTLGEWMFHSGIGIAASKPAGTASWLRHDRWTHKIVMKSRHAWGRIKVCGWYPKSAVGMVASQGLDEFILLNVTMMHVQTEAKDNSIRAQLRSEYLIRHGCMLSLHHFHEKIYLYATIHHTHNLIGASLSEPHTSELVLKNVDKSNAPINVSPPPWK